ncbi:transcriptional regulator NrdR [Peptoniphilus indolicus]|uniref:Transcriptional repressor NrdR n=2 Tax=Peptoniphilus indolicus TaxID=33030 RepID=G4D482_9FIRM|nr:transcriptional regulator NrdR [Peptoniphilus indolicus]EGY79687.1 iron oxidase [Peptoniphilus indolicus ATCC 29427]SUB75901.1 Transcriptional repressor NrdR [Peptoniphilus indolicus]
MKCPHCGYGDSKVLDSRPTDEGNAIRRRRECNKCKNRFTTYEKIEETPIMVIKKDGTRETFDVSKIIKGMIKSVEKRPVSVEDIEKAAWNIEREVNSSFKGEITSNEIGDLVMRELKDLDEVSYIRFASVYRQFKDVESFFIELEEIIKNRK